MIRSVNLIGMSASEARALIRDVLEAEPTATRKVYAGLAQMVWVLLIEARPEGELRDWHDLLHRVRTRIRGADGVAAERITALADLLRESISSWTTFGCVRAPKALSSSAQEPR